jgi:hypothetical protein
VRGFAKPRYVLLAQQFVCAAEAPTCKGWAQAAVPQGLVPGFPGPPGVALDDVLGGDLAALGGQLAGQRRPGHAAQQLEAGQFGHHPPPLRLGLPVQPGRRLWGVPDEFGPSLTGRPPASTPGRRPVRSLSFAGLAGAPMLASLVIRADELTL